MNTTISIQVVRHPEFSTVEVNDAIELAFGEFDRIVKQYTRFNQDSELSNLNRNQGTKVTVTAEFANLIHKMLKMAEATNGSFDPTIIDFLEAYGYDPNYDFSKLDNPDLDKNIRQMALTRPSWREIELDLPNQTVRLASGQRIDLGGIGKGYAIDCAYAKLDKFPDFLIDAGGDIRCKGKNSTGGNWKLDLAHQSTDSRKIIIGQVEVSDIAIACSGSWARRVKQFHHILDPRTGAPVESMATVYISTDTATDADAWATAVFVGGRKTLTQMPESQGALLIDKHNKAIISDTFPKVINLSI